MDNSLSKIHPELVCEWSERNLPVTPDTVSYGSNKVFWWKGACGHEWQTSVKARHDGEKCPICANARIVPGINDLETLCPQLAEEWSEKNLYKPSEVSIESHKKAWWIGKCGHEWEAEVRSRAKKGNGCPYCSGHKLLPGFNDLKTRFPKIAREWSPRNKPLKPTMVTAYTNRRVWWRCRNCGNEWYALISTRSGGSKCPYCSGIILLPGFNDLKTRYPLLAAEWSERNEDLQPDMVNEKSRKNVWWHCNRCGQEYKAVICSRVHGLKCPVCADRKVQAGFNDLATTDPKIAKDWDYERNSLLPTMVSRSSYKRVWWRCKYGHHWSMIIYDRTINGKGCIYCELDFMENLPELAAAYYTSLLKLQVVIGNDDLTGIPLTAYIPEAKLAIDVITKKPRKSDKAQAYKQYFCKIRGITLAEIRMDRKTDGLQLISDMKKAFQKGSLFIQSDEAKDLALIRRTFEKLREQKT